MRRNKAAFEFRGPKYAVAVILLTGLGGSALANRSGDTGGNQSSN
jgi:hypothetical protein